ncbi:mannonate dehydratase [Salipaludibacillus neizhouensis]|uniref:Mannonate dehydratase n=1 Tax=Salipaludibacillus neizhouensis TaxID=885475 RepID=A0A3A9JZD8_9BACI|nr:mannonate dehydratase [Salipaludibacillus neizhouensis]RKL65549.1 mannonate dehydratase [Salipaludibacillus neizhouensis]
MEMSFRWYGDDDPVTLDKIRQIPDMKGIVSAIYDIPAGEVWPYEEIVKLKEKVEKHGLKVNVIESVPVHEEIKMGLDTRDKWIENYKQTIRNLSKAGIYTVCYNFMPVFDWTRSELDAPLPDGSNSLKYDEETVKNLDPLSGELTLPGWDLSFQTDELGKIMERYQTISEDQLMDNLVYFLEKVIPVAEEEDVLMAIHPDDPPWPIFGLPRIIKNKDSVKHMLQAVDSPNNGITFCTGSYGADPKNNLLEIIEVAKGRIHFVHARNVKWTGELSFQETSHSVKDGSIDMVGVMKKLIEDGYEGPIRPDHGRMIWGETGRPGYGLYDRALGATYLNGIIDAIKK